MRVGERIREARESRGLTQSELAAQVGVTPSFVTKVEKNETLPSYDRLVALANALALDPEGMLSLLERSRQERFDERQRTRRMAVRGAYGLDGGKASPGPAAENAEQFAREMIENSELRVALGHLRQALADPQLRTIVLKTLEAFAAEARTKPASRRHKGK